MQFQNVKIPARIAITCLVPIVAFTAFAMKSVFEKHAIFSSADQIATVAEAVPEISGLIHELQRERGASVGYVDSKGQIFVDVVKAQRPATDKALTAWRQRMDSIAQANLGARFTKAVGEARTKLGELQQLRAGADAFSIAGPAVVEFFTPTIDRLIASIDSIGDMTRDGRILREASALSAIIKRKEFAGQERAVGTGGFTKGEFAAPVHRRFSQLSALQDAQAAAFALNATPGQIAFVDTTLKSAGLEELARMRLAGSESPFKGNVGGVTGPQWFEAATKYIDAMRTVEHRFANEMVENVRALASEARWGFWGVLALFAVLLAIAGGLSVVVAMSITKPIGKLVAAMGELAGGNTAIDVPGVTRGDEVGTMAKAVLVFRDAAIEQKRMQEQTLENERRTAAEKSERERIEAEQKIEADKRTQAEREAATAKVMNEFDAAVGGIVNAAMEGDFSQRVPLEGKEGVIRNLAGALNAMCENIGAVLDDNVRMMTSLADGDLTRRITAEYHGTFATLKDSANTTAERLAQIVSDIKGAAAEVSNAAAEISTSTTDLSQRTEEQAAGLEETSASMEEIAATVKKNAENAQEANQLTAGTREVADKGGQVVANAVQAMSRIEESSRKISDIIGVIDEIARQTNLLALNAAVEAARAGDAGRGFAVVASEVRSLAQRSSQAAKDIKDLITNSNSQVQEGVELVNQAGTSLNEIVESIKSVANIVADIANASTEQSTGIEQVNKALTQMDEVTQQNSALVEENAATAKTLETQSGAMNQRVSFFRLEQGAAGVHAVKSEPKPEPKSEAKPVPVAKPIAPRPTAAPRRAAGGPVGRMQSQIATAIKQDHDWEEF